MKQLILGNEAVARGLYEAGCSFVSIYPVQIEDFLRSHDKIKDVAVIGLPDPRLGEITAAIIEIKDGMTCTE